MGVKQVMVTHDTRLVGIITKKDVIRHMARMAGKDVSVKFH